MRTPITRLPADRHVDNLRLRAEFSAAVRGASAEERAALAEAEIEELSKIDISGMSRREREPVKRRWLGMRTRCADTVADVTITRVDRPAER